MARGREYGWELNVLEDAAHGAGAEWMSLRDCYKTHLNGSFSP